MEKQMMLMVWIMFRKFSKVPGLCYQVPCISKSFPYDAG
jgi:hypothetical protein